MASPGDSSSDAAVEEIKADIARMREEALQRLETLNEQMHQAESALNGQKELEQSLTPSRTISNRGKIPSQPSVPLQCSSPHKDSSTTVVSVSSEDASAFKEAEVQDALFQDRFERDSLHFLEHVDPKETGNTLNEHTSSITTTLSEDPVKSPEAGSHSSPSRLLEDTRWRLMLNIGREPGTWMPKDWGVSGDRLRMHLEMEFSAEQLYEREEFLNGISGARVLNVIHEEAHIAPSMREGGRSVRVKSGGWRVAPSEGPMGTNVLRFYFDLEEKTQHRGSDVYCPLGRIFCTCGYFPMTQRNNRIHYVSEKETLKQAMDDLGIQYEALVKQNEQDTNLISWSKLQRSKQLMDLRMEANKLNHRMHEAHVREPDKSLLRLSQDQSVGLTKEGGVCCRVNKGLAIEYHILGKFETASMVNREHSDYRDLLP